MVYTCSYVVHKQLWVYFAAENFSQLPILTYTEKHVRLVLNPPYKLP